MPWLLAIAVEARADDVADAIGRGDLEELEALRARYPQDYALALEVGWLAFQEGRYALAEEAYTDAATLSGGSRDAVLGLAWTRQRLGDRRGALALLDQLDADDPAVAELRAATRDPAYAVLLAGGAWTALPSGDGGPATSATEVRAGASGRSAHLGGGAVLVVTQTPLDVGALDVATWGHADAGSALGGVELVGALFVDPNGDLTPGGVIGGVARWSPWGDGRLEASWTHPRGELPQVVRLSPSWFLPFGPIGVEPLAAVQLTDGEVLPSGGGTLWLVTRPLALWAGGRGGPQQSVTLLRLRASAAWPDRETAGAWAGLRLGRVDRAWVAGQWAGAWFDAAGARPRIANTLSLTLSLTPGGAS
ncbi:MAG: tetratricopeptide repeat protein [Alphaproteobacteria bacterium]|nr:tetratricopeptide repeat protein [Alphaproteobacteria bacterium]